MQWIRRFLRPLKPLLDAGVRWYVGDPSYYGDKLMTWGKSVAFLNDPDFSAAYQRGMNSGHHIGRVPGSTTDIHIEWRVHVLLWAAWHARHLPGDFVECGVNTGICSLAVCEYLDFNSLNKSFWLFDTFAGIPIDQVTEREKKLGRLEENKMMYSDCYATALHNFSPYPKAHLIRGKVPETLHDVDIDAVCYLSIDMNIVEPEIAAIEFFWDKLSAGALVILDDYGGTSYVAQHEAMNAFAASKNVKICELPTGQGLLIKPAA